MKSLESLRLCTRAHAMLPRLNLCQCVRANIGFNGCILGNLNKAIKMLRGKDGTNGGTNQRDKPLDEMQDTDNISNDEAEPGETWEVNIQIQ